MPASLQKKLLVLCNPRMVGSSLRYLRPSWLIRRFLYLLRIRSGMVRRQTPLGSWDSFPLEEYCREEFRPLLLDYLACRRNKSPLFFFHMPDLLEQAEIFQKWDQDDLNPVAAAEKMAAGNFCYFEYHWIRTGFPPQWHYNPFTDQRVPADRHWSRIEDFGHGDIKMIWEPSRFGFAYMLVRAYARTANDRFARIFWELVEDWRHHNPPNVGPNWKCGQEICFRTMALCFGLYGFLYSKETTHERLTALAQIIAVSGERIEANLDYALSQRNNHSISEGLGLWTIGLLFPEFKAAGRWLSKSRDVLEQCGHELIDEDGSFVQHSMNYHRLMLHDYLWGVRLGDLNRQKLSAKLKKRIWKAAVLLYQVQDEETGSVPRYGQNDGALILPLNNCSFQNFRPALQAVYYLTNGRRLFEAGPWDEDLIWLFGRDTLRAGIEQIQRINLNAKTGGYYTLRSSRGFAFVRCSKIKARPSQADMLHTDIWWRGINIALDPGTFSYNAPEPWNNPLASTDYHNTVTVDGRNQMERVSKFIWLPWIKSEVTSMGRSEKGFIDYWQGEHNGYHTLKGKVNYSRGILRLGAEHWLVLDQLSSDNAHDYRLHWLCADHAYRWDGQNGRLDLHTPEGNYAVLMRSFKGTGSYSLVRADQRMVRGWYAPFYYSKAPAISIDLTVTTDSDLFVTLLGPEPAEVSLSPDQVSVSTSRFNAACRLNLHVGEPLTMIDAVTIHGDFEDKMGIIRCASC